MQKKMFIIGILFAVSAVVLGALGAHALEKILSPEQLDSFETGVTYQMYHALALLLFAQTEFLISSSKKVIIVLFSCGILLFSISIYMLCMSAYWQIDLSFLGPITPIGGLLLISGWIFALWKFIGYKSANN
ncbi:DUF423 domain-containing protein [Nonlabens xiamenensis]|uniref:DUF423 domain-containing protein n=1 Tax=Nonlabens xiamenensis TaxID=2341043 RepID=UPI000F60F239|nr:DUF423 domain-containing protein [Nonlabens xiamenensis]